MRLSPTLRLGLAILVLFAATLRVSYGPGVRWVEGYEAAVAQAKASEKPLLVEFYADWCGPCRLMEATTFRDGKVVRRAESFVPVRVNIDQRRDLAVKFGVSSIPYVVVLAPGGEMKADAAGFHTAGQFLQFLERGLAE